ncbi:MULTISPECIES: hypothetical protein [Staphylococcaceae]|uniref:hypothetical protein n=1 Tax=Staphylococcaceae TaxID=90964 RepID=UPI000D1D7261|nr:MULTISPECIES: hypothetical protein [Staphylococcaceae]MBG3875407.1 hypothetical protein [Staphylococcus xylosus]MCC4221796.1 hypothetical protein [Staphylococcus saprophyticus]PTI36227.1 hypothetical protein BU074_11090 [Mammaliicoccus vitulinus]RIN26062.1 hypothetical protein BU067_06880 [Staphylococcus succinus]
MERYNYFENALKVIDKIDEYEWSPIILNKILPKNIVEVISYYDTVIKESDSNELGLAFVQYEYDFWLDENDNTVSSDYALIFFIKYKENEILRPLLFMDSKEYNTFLYENDKDFSNYSLADVIRKITEIDVDLDDLFKGI